MEPTRTHRFEELFRAHYPAVRGYALRRTSPETAQDAVAETFLVAWRRLDDVPADALPWLFGVARRVLANRRRSAGRSAALLRQIGAAELPGVTAAPRGRFGGPAVAYDPEENTIRHMRFGRLPVRTPVINSNRDPGADLRELERHGRLSVAGTTQVDGREAYRLVSGLVPGTPKGSVDRLEYVVDAETYYPVSLRWRHHFRRHVIEINTRFLVYERLPLDARGRELLRLDPHPGAVELDRMGRRVRD